MGKLRSLHRHTGHGHLNGSNVLTTLSIAPKKTKGEKMDLGTFLTDSSMLCNPCRTSGHQTAADEASSPGFMGR